MIRSQSNLHAAPTSDDLDVARTIAAAQSSRLILNAFAAVFLADGGDPTQCPTPKQARHHGSTETGRVRRLSIKRLVKDLRATGERVVIEQGKNGTTRVLCGEENNKAPDNYWDEKLK